MYGAAAQLVAVQEAILTEARQVDAHSTLTREIAAGVAPAAG